MNKEVMFSSMTNEWATPQDTFDELNREFNFTLDPCATPENAKCSRFYTKDDDGLRQSWVGEVVFCNPPYGRAIGTWVKKAHDEANAGATVVMLIPARTDTTYFHNYIYHRAEVRFIRGRLRFGGVKNAAPFSSMVVIFHRSDIRPGVRVIDKSSGERGEVKRREGNEISIDWDDGTDAGLFWPVGDFIVEGGADNAV